MTLVSTASISADAGAVVKTAGTVIDAGAVAILEVGDCQLMLEQLQQRRSVVANE